MAGLGRKVFAAGEVLTAANVQGYLQDQVVQVYDDATDRSTVLGTAVTEGMVSYLKDVNTVQVWDGSTWKVVTSDPTLTSSTATAYTVQESDAGNYLVFTASGTVTISAATGFSTSQQVQIFNDNAVVTVKGSGVTLAGAGTAGTAASFVTNETYSGFGILCVGANDYRVIGNISAV